MWHLVKYKTGASIRADDALSCKEEENTGPNVLFLLRKPMSSILEHSSKENKSLLDLLELNKNVAAGTLINAYSIRDEVLCYKNRFVIGAN